MLDVILYKKRIQELQSTYINWVKLSKFEMRYSGYTRWYCGNMTCDNGSIILTFDERVRTKNNLFRWVIYTEIIFLNPNCFLKEKGQIILITCRYTIMDLAHEHHLKDMNLVRPTETTILPFSLLTRP